MNYHLLHLLSIIFQLNSNIFLDSGCNQLIYINTIIPQYLEHNCEKQNDVFGVFKLKIKIWRAKSPKPPFVMLQLYDYSHDLVQKIVRTLDETSYTGFPRCKATPNFPSTLLPAFKKKYFLGNELMIHKLEDPFMH